MDDFQDIANSAQNIDVSREMTSGGVSDSVNIADAVLNSGYQSPLNETLSESLRRVSELTAASYSQVYENTPDLNFGIGFGGGGGNGGVSKNPFNGDPLFQMDNSESLKQEIDLDQYYTRMSDEWDRTDKGTGGAVAVGGLALTGAATGAAIGSMIAPVAGTIVGGVIGGILGAVEGSQVAKTVGAGYVRNKYGVNEDAYSKTGFFGGAGTASMKLIHSANAVNLSLVGMIAYAPQAIAQGSLNTLFNNKFTKMLDDYDKSSESSNRVYHSKDYQNASLLGSFGYSEMWVEKVAPALGFTIGALAGGKGTSILLRGAGLTGTGTASASRAFLSALPKNVALAESRTLGVKALTQGFKDAVKADLKAQTFKSLAGNTIATMVSAAPEAGIEARGAMNEAREDFQHYFQIANGRVPTSSELETFEQENIRTGNGVFGANMAILSASNWLQFGDLIGVDKAVREGFFDNVIKNTFGLGIKRTATAATEKGVEQAVWSLGKRSLAQRAGYGIFKALENPLTEGAQEGFQGIITGTQKDYLESRFNPKATEANKNLMSSLGDSFAHTMTSREGWEEILIGGLVGGISSVRTKGGFDVMSIRESMNAGKVVQRQVDNLNQTSEAFTKSHEDYLNRQSDYNRMNNNYVARFNDRLGSSNQQMFNSDRSKQHMANGELELARTSYQNSLFAKLAAERKAGVSESSKFDVGMLIEETPDQVLKDMYGFQSEEQIAEFKEQTAKRLTDIHESFDAAYDMAEALNLGTGKGMSEFSPSQVTEMAALNFFHGMQSADNANSIARNLEGVVGINGVADAMNHYDNLSVQNKERAQRADELKSQIAELEKKHSELLSSFSRETAKPTRAAENETTVSYLDKINAQLAAISDDISRLESERETIDELLDSQENMPSLPFGNAASKFFDSTNLKFGDKSTREVLEQLKAFDKYIAHLQDTTSKTEEEIATDVNKADTIKNMVENYRSQMGLMRNFAKQAQMVADPAYVNNVAKSIFNSKKYDEIFDNQDWVDNNSATLDEMSVAEYKELRQQLEDGEISKYDIHTFLTNAEILRTGRNTIASDTVEDPVSDFDLNTVLIAKEDGEMVFDTESETGKQLIESTIQAVIENNLSPNQKVVLKYNQEYITKEVFSRKSKKASTIADTVKEGKNDTVKEQERLTKLANEKKDQVEFDVVDKFPLSKLISGELTLPGTTSTQTVGNTRMETEIVEAETLVPGDKVFYMDDVRTVKGMTLNLYGVDTLTFEDGLVVTNIDTGTFPIKKVTKEATVAPTTTSTTTVENIRRSKLGGWEASYELATIAEKEGVRLSEMTREEYVDYAIKNYLKVDDDVIRGNPLDREAKSVQEVIARRKAQASTVTNEVDKSFSKFSFEMLQLAGSKLDKFLSPGVRILSGTAGSNSWLHFGINTADTMVGDKTFKAYMSLKDLNNFTPESLKDFMKELQKRGYNGQVKTFQDLRGQAANLNDQVVMHGITQQDTDLAYKTAQEFFGDQVLDMSVGMDEKVNGKSKSYTQLLSSKMSDTIDQNLINPPIEVSQEVGQSEELSMEEALKMVEAEIQRQKDMIDADLKEALNPTTKENLEIKTALKELNDAINEIVKNVVAQNKEINTDQVDTFTKNSTPLIKELKEIEDILAATERTPRLEARLEELLAKVNAYGLVEGRIASFNDQDIRLSDLLEQRAQLENELFSRNKTVTPLTPEEMLITFDSTTEDETTIKEGQKVGDAAVLNNYDFATFILTGNNYQIANLRPQGFVEEITRGVDHSVIITGPDNSVRTVDTEQGEWDNEVQPGDSVVVNLTDTNGNLNSIVFTIDSSRRILLPVPNAELLSEITNLSFSGRNKIGATKYQVLTKIVDGLETYLDSDFGVELDTEATQSLTPGEGIVFEFDSESTYNQALLDEYYSVHPDPSAEELVAERTVNELIEQVRENKELLKGKPANSEALKKENLDLLAEIKLYVPGVKGNSLIELGAAVKGRANLYRNQFDKTSQDEVKKKMKENMVLVAKDKAGNRVGIVKSLNNSSVNKKGRAQMDHLRSALMDQVVENDFKPGTKSKFTVPVQIVYMGIPNIKVEAGEQVNYRFSEEVGERNINPSKIKSVGYITYGKMEFSDKRKIDTPYNYAKKIMNDEKYQGKRVPIVSFMHQGKEIIYPISLIEKGTESASDRLAKLLEQKDSMMVGEFILQVNDFLAENGVDKSTRLTSLNIDKALPRVIEVVESIQNIPSIDELMDSANASNVLMESAYIDINLNDKPFAGPKIRFDLNAVPESESKLLEKDSILDSATPQTMEEIANESNVENCLD